MVPDGIDDPRRPSGGNVYDRRACRGLARARLVGPRARRARPVAPARSRRPARPLAAALARVPSGALVLDRRPGRVGGAGGAGAGSRPAAPRRTPAHAAGRAARGRGAVGGVRDRGHEPVDQAVAERPLRAARGIACTSCRPASTRPKLAAGTPSGGRLLCVGAVTPLKGHDLLLDALATVDDPAWRCVCVGALDVDPEFVARPATAGRGQRARRSGVLHRPAHGRRARPRVRSRRTSWCWPRAPRPTAWSSPRRLPAGFRSSPATSVACLRPSVTQPTAARPACWCRPTTRRLSASVQGLAGRPPGARAAPRGGPVPATRRSATGRSTSRELSAVLSAVAG